MERAYSIELIKLLETLKTNNPAQLQNRKVRDLNQEEREIYMAALKKKGQADRKKLFKLIKMRGSKLRP